MQNGAQTRKTRGIGMGGTTRKRRMRCQGNAPQQV